MKKIIYFKKIEESKSKSDYTGMINEIFGRCLDIHSESGSIYVLTDAKLKNISENIEEIMELEMSEIIFKHISLKEPEILTLKEEKEIFEKNIIENLHKETIKQNPIEEDKLENETSYSTKTIKNNDINIEKIVLSEMPVDEPKSVKTTQESIAIEVTKTKKKKIFKEPLPEDIIEKKFENCEKQTEKKFGIKEFFAVIFTFLFIGINIYLWMLLKSKN